MSRRWELSKRDPHGIAYPEDKRVCDCCNEVYSRRSAALGSNVCPRCERHYPEHTCDTEDER